MSEDEIWREIGPGLRPESESRAVGTAGCRDPGTDGEYEEEEEESKSGQGLCFKKKFPCQSGRRLLSTR